MSNITEDFCALEASTWACLEKGDADCYMDFYSEDFVGWPEGSEKPANKAAAIEGTKAFLENIKPNTYVANLSPCVVNTYQNDTVMTFYTVQQIYEDLEGYQNIVVERVTHTWQKEGEAWHIIGGMSSASKSIKYLLDIT